MELSELTWIFGLGLLLAIAAALPALAIRSYLVARIRQQSQRHLSWARTFESGACALFTIDEQGTILASNQAAANLFGYSLEEIRGENMARLTPVVLSPLGLNALHAAPMTPNGIGHEVTGQRKDGSSIPLDMRLTEMEGMDSRCFLVAVRDLSERRLLEQHQREASLIGSILRAIEPPILVFDREGRVCRHSRGIEDRTGLEAGEIAGRHYWELMLPQSEWSRAKMDLAEVVSSTTGKTMETLWWGKPGEATPALVALTPVITGMPPSVAYIIAAGQPAGAAKAEDKEKAESSTLEALERMAEGVARQFTELLTAISGYSELILHSLKDDDPLRRDVEQIQKAGERAAALTLELLAFSGKAPMRLEEIHLNDLILKVRPAIELLLGERIQLRLTLDLGLGRGRGDTSWFEQCLLTLAANARKAMPEGGEFALETSSIALESPQESAAAGLPTGHYVLLTAIHGGAVPPEEVERLLEPFHGPLSETGLALGLSAVHGVARQFGGNLTVEHPAGGGTRLRIRLPRHEETAQPETSRRGLYLVKSAGQ